jgi:hypothetical protein
VQLLFSLYLSDIPSTLSNQLQFTYDIALTYQHESFSDCEANLERMNQYFHRRRLQLNPSKTESCVFHLSKHHANRTLDLQFAATQIQHVEHPKYLSVTLDRSWTNNTHLSKTAKSCCSRLLGAETGEQALKHYELLHWHLYIRPPTKPTKPQHNRYTTEKYNAVKLWDCKINTITMTASAGEHRPTKTAT